MERQISNGDGYIYETTPGLDRLETMLQAQKDFTKNLHARFPHLGLASHEKRANEAVTYIIQEAAEAREELPFKDYKDYSQKKTDWGQFQFELIDILKFTLNAWLESGGTAESLYQAFCQKSRINIERQNNGY